MLLETAQKRRSIAASLRLIWPNGVLFVRQVNFIKKMSLRRKIYSLSSGCILILAIVIPQFYTFYAGHAAETPAVNVWLTSSDGQLKLAKQATSLTFQAGNGNGSNTIVVDDSAGQTFQKMVGFGAAMTDSSAYLLAMGLAPDQETALMQNLFGQQGSQSIGLSFIRQPIGASDLTLPRGFALKGADGTPLMLNGQPVVAPGVYSYDGDNTGANTWNGGRPGDGAGDIKAGADSAVAPGTAVVAALPGFSIAHDELYILPMLKQARALNPDLSILGSPWSPPAWMKDRGSMIGGNLTTDNALSLAYYLTKYIDAYQKDGLTINYITPQNEPLYTDGQYPTAGMSAQDEASVIQDMHKLFVDPSLTSPIRTQILAYDHNWGDNGYPKSVLSAAGNAANGIAYHCYSGDASVQNDLVNTAEFSSTYGASSTLTQTPHIFQTECTNTVDQGWSDSLNHTANLLIDTTRNWGSTVTMWGLATEASGAPSLQTGGCNTCAGVVYIDPNTHQVTYNVDYYALGQASKFVLPGAVHIGSGVASGGSGVSKYSNNPNLSNVAFKNPDGSEALIVYNSGGDAQTTVEWNGSTFTYTIPGNTMATFSWGGVGSNNVQQLFVNNPDLATGTATTADTAGSSITHRKPLTGGVAGLAGGTTDDTGRTLVWSDEFQGNAGDPPDPKNWHADVGGDGWGNQQLEYDTDNKNALQDGQGNLVISATTDGANQYQCWYGACKYTSARIETSGLYTTDKANAAGLSAEPAGRVEARIKLPTGKGLWPAFWMMGTNGQQWPANGEVDILENHGDDTAMSQGSIHGPGEDKTQIYHLTDSSTFADSYHIFGVNWDQNQIAFTIDNTTYETINRSDIPTWLFSGPFYILLNVAVGGNYSGNPDGSTQFPQQMLVDYVRVYSAPNGSN